MKSAIYTILLISFFYTHSFAQRKKMEPGYSYDMRKDLKPSRLTIAMWDFSWLYCHYKGGSFADFDKVTNELLERGFNTVRIDAFPLIIGSLSNIEEEITIANSPLKNWGQSVGDQKHSIVKELTEFMEITKRKNIHVILSTWSQGCVEYPNVRTDFNSKEKYWGAWEKVLDLLRTKNLLTHVCYVDLDQEFPYFSPFESDINSAIIADKVQKKISDDEAMNMANNQKNSQTLNDFQWTASQMIFVKILIEESLSHFQEKYPNLRFTYSFTNFWEEIRAMKIKSFDVLELHFWMSSDKRFISRSTFGQLQKDRGEHDYSEYMSRLNGTLHSIRPMMLKQMHNQLLFAKEWSEEIAAPLTTTEAWGPWWHMDHKDLEWKWLYDWCEEGMKLSSDYGLWGTTPWNFSHPYWNNWTNIEWYKTVNNRFLKE